VVATALSGQVVVAAAAAALTVGWIWWARVAGRTQATHVASRAAILTSFAATFVHQAPAQPVAVGVALALLLTVMAEPFIEPQLRPAITLSQLPGSDGPLARRLQLALFTASCGSIVLLTVAVVSAGLSLVASALAVLWAAGLVALSIWQLRQVHRGVPQRKVRAALEGYRPEYYLYYSGPIDGAYQLEMWLPHLAKTGARGALLIRERTFLPQARRVTDLPIVVAESVEPMEYALVDSVRTIFYVNNSAKNADGTRYPQVRHVHLGHGDSDKPSSYALSTAMFDEIFVAGQVGADRFASHGVLVPAEKFVLVGRPQITVIEPRRSPAPVEHPTVLYAPTWRGVLADMQLSSLDAGTALVRGLIGCGARVIFRPHPFAARDSTSRALTQQIDQLLAADRAGGHWLSREASEPSVFECMNASDALLSDVSSVVSDYLYSGKPIALTHRGSAQQVRAEYPFAAACALIDLDAELGEQLSDFLAADALTGERLKAREYYLGPWPADRYADVFVDAARSAISAGGRRQQDPYHSV